jgi:hypothetical protein
MHKLGTAMLAIATLGLATIAIKLWWPPNVSAWDVLRWSAHALLAGKILIKLGAGVAVAVGWLGYKLAKRQSASGPSSSAPTTNASAT